jgi:DNA-binding response OmpR family regulator
MMMTTETATSVLVVDDEPQVVWMLRFSLEAEGFQTLSARDGAAALAEIRQHHPKLMLLDVMMPVMDGYSVLEELRSMPEAERPRVVMVSARASLRDRAKAAELGADAFVAKPFSVDELIGVLRSLEPQA